MGNEYILSLPLLLIFIFSVVILLVDSIWHSKKAVYAFSIFSLVAVLAAAVNTMFATPAILTDAVAGAVKSNDIIAKNIVSMVTLGGYAGFLDMVFCIGGILTLLASRSYITREYNEYNEYYTLILFSVSGMMFIAHASNFLLLFIGIEIMSISFYVLAGYFRKRTRSVEAALKYFLLGSFATGFLLYGIAMIYGATGSLSLPGIHAKIMAGTGYNPLYLNIGLGLLIVGLGFKVAAFPFHQWAPDVYHGSPTVISGFMSATGKAAAIIAFVIVTKALIVIAPDGSITVASSKTAQMIIALISAATMLIGNITALIQKNIKRMLSYSSVAYAGYLLMGIVAGNATGMNGILFYATAYMFMQTGAFIVISLLERNDEQFLEISDYAGLSKSYPLLSAVMAMFMFSLAGIPPFAGFFGKYYLFVGAIEGGFTWLTIIAVISSIISMYFYIGLIIQMYFKEATATETGERLDLNTGNAKIALAISAFAILLFGILPSLITNLTEKFF
jgi:NADH-quinone oxidoreductase subunit N